MMEKRWFSTGKRTRFVFTDSDSQTTASSISTCLQSVDKIEYKIWYIDFSEGALMDVLSLVRDLEWAIPPIEIDQDLDETYDRPYCRKITLQDSELNINQYPVVFMNHDLGERERERDRDRLAVKQTDRQTQTDKHNRKKLIESYGGDDKWVSKTKWGKYLIIVERADFRP